MSGIKIEFDELAAVGELMELNENCEKQMDRMMSEFRRRVPTWIAQGVAKDYNIKKSDVSKKSKVKVEGLGVGDLTFTYTGRMLTPTSFGMSPTAPMPGAYTIKASIKRGQRATIGHVKKLTKKQLKARGRNFTRQGTRTSPASPPMLQYTGNKRADGTNYIPFQRTKPGGSTTGGPMDHVIKTISVPQMIKDGQGQTKPGIEKILNENIEKRFNHYTDQIMK